jgi:hypothetical protein
MSARRGVTLVLIAICTANFTLYARWVIQPYLLADDFQILLRSWSWQATWDNLWVPANEHAMPLGRLTTAVLIHLADRISIVPHLTAWQGPLAILAAILLLYLFVRRELDHPLYALTAAAMFGVSTVYQQAVFWFSASFSILTLVTLLLALLAAQQWQRTGRFFSMVLCVLGSGLAPAWFASGVLAGPLCTLYLLPPSGGKNRNSLVPSVLFALLPLLGTILFLAVSLPRTLEMIMHLEHYGQNRTALNSFHLLRGLQYTTWSIVENLLLGSIGIASLNIPFGLAVAVWPMLVVLGAWWVRDAREGRRLMLLGCGFIFAGYLLVYSARAEWNYAGEMNRPGWSRYHLLPQLGLALFIAGGLTGRVPTRSISEGAAPGLTRSQRQALLMLVVCLWVLHMPRTIFTTLASPEDTQQQDLQRIDAADALCRQYHIGQATAHAALSADGSLEISGCGGRENGWDFLRGSPDPDPSITLGEARRVLAPVVQERSYRK